jgi:hypothetical protein
MEFACATPHNPSKHLDTSKLVGNGSHATAQEEVEISRVTGPITRHSSCGRDSTIIRTK